MTWFKSLVQSITHSKYKKQTRRRLEDVKPGDSIRIEWNRIKGGIGYIKCINNDPIAKKLFLEMKWSNYVEAKCDEFQQIILPYDCVELKNFNLLNPLSEEKPELDEIDENNLAALLKKKSEALSDEKYELAEELQKKIDKLIIDK